MIKNRSILSQSAWRMINLALAKETSIYAAMLLSGFLFKQERLELGNLMPKDGFFFYKMDEIEEETLLSSFKQRSALSLLVQYKLVEIGKTKTAPTKQTYKLNMSNIEILVSKLH